MRQQDYKKIFDKISNDKISVKKACPKADERSGIYAFTRRDENGILYAYIGKSCARGGIIERLAQHLNGYNQWIDKSIRKHGLAVENNPYGWNIEIVLHCPESDLNDWERHFIKQYAKLGYQLRNIESGGLSGKTDINERKPSKGYYDGKKQGRADLAKELKQTLKYLNVTPQNDSKIAERMVQKFWDILGERNNG